MVIEMGPVTLAAIERLTYALEDFAKAFADANKGTVMLSEVYISNEGSAAPLPDADQLPTYTSAPCTDPSCPSLMSGISHVHGAFPARPEQDEEMHLKAQETTNLTADRNAYRCIHCNQLRSEHRGARFFCLNQESNPYSMQQKTFTPRES